MSNCNTCNDNPELIYLNLLNVTEEVKTFSLEPVGHSDLHVCVDNNPGSKFVDNKFSMCLSPRDLCASNLKLTQEFELEGDWGVEIDGELVVESASIEALSQILLAYDLNLNYRKFGQLYPDCAYGTNLVEISPDFSYDMTVKDTEVRIQNNWDIYINNKYYATTSVYNNSDSTYVEDILDRHPDFSASYEYIAEDSYSSVTIRNISDKYITLMFVPTNPEAKPLDEMNAFGNPSIVFNLESQSFAICLSPENVTDPEDPEEPEEPIDPEDPKDPEEPEEPTEPELPELESGPFVDFKLQLKAGTTLFEVFDLTEDKVITSVEIPSDASTFNIVKTLNNNLDEDYEHIYFTRLSKTTSVAPGLFAEEIRIQNTSEEVIELGMSISTKDDSTTLVGDSTYVLYSNTVGQQGAAIVEFETPEPTQIKVYLFSLSEWSPK